MDNPCNKHTWTMKSEDTLWYAGGWQNSVRIQNFS